MSQEICIWFIGPDRTGLIAHITNYLFDKEVNISDIACTATGDNAELTIIHTLPRGVTMEEIEKDLKGMPELSDGTLEVSPYHFKEARGPSSTVTHRFTLAGDDIPGLIAKISKTLDEHGANIVRMNSETHQGIHSVVNISRFAVSLRQEKAPDCLAAIVMIACELKLTFRYEAT